MLIALTLLTPATLTAAVALAGAFPAETTHRIRRAAGVLAPLAVLPAAALALSSPADGGARTGVAGEGAGPVLEVPWLMLGSSFAVDPAARSLLLIAVLLYGSALMAISWVKLRNAERGSGALSAFLLASFTGNAGVYLATDVVSFYLGFTLMSFAATGLVIHYRTAAAQRATRIYLVLSVLSETAILAGLLLMASELMVPSEDMDPTVTGEAPESPSGGLLLEHVPEAVTASDHTGLILTLLLAGFGIKAGTMPLHVWLPLAHPAAPPAASAVLSGAMVKAGLVGWLRFLPLDEETASETVATAGGVLLVLALLGSFLAVLFGVLQEDPKVVLAYSTISQMGFIACLVAAGMLRPELAPAATTAAVLYAVHHGLAKGALFLGVPVVKHYVPAGMRSLTGTVVVLGMAGAGLAVAGAPLSSGALGKYTSKEAVEGIAVLGVGLEHILPLVATGSTVLLMRFAAVMAGTVEEGPRRSADGELVSWLLMVGAGITLPWWIGEQWLLGAGLPVETPGWELSAVWDASWPVLLGILLGAAAWTGARRGFLPWWVASADGSAVQPGDLIVAEESAVVRIQRAGGRSLESLHRMASGANAAVGSGAAGTAEALRRNVDRVESQLGRWEASGLVIVLLTTVLTVLLALVVLTGWIR